MRTLYLDCGMGAAGDMLTAALLELLTVEQRAEFISKVNSLGIPGVRFEAKPSVKCGITGTHVSVFVDGEEEGEEMFLHHHHHDHEHDHEHEHEHVHTHDLEDGHSHIHSHSGLADIEHIVRGHLDLPESVRDDVMAVYSLIAEAESHVHGQSVEQIHFHEVGTMDAVADVTAVCLLMDILSPQQIICSPVHVGSGKVRCAHGLLPVPAPATAYILRDVPIYGGRIQGELCTPTGAALLRHFVTSFGDMPPMKVSSIGYGMGNKDFEAANCVRAMLGETGTTGDTVAELSLNVDDMTAEQIGFLTETLFEAGALEVYTVPIGMKKSRPGTLISVMTRESDKDRIIELIFRHSTTLGVRENISRRYTLDRRIETVETRFGAVRKKISSGYGVTREKYEYDDLSRIARDNGMSITDVRREISREEEV
ncbi:MAG: nickel pincer cofactor biosynthesis protein LarC [Oscillospiraceae bacterium]|nr:nickel pincer cofactor biosynthesis protein LarC [Oscillospiraceae bacterium]